MENETVVTLGIIFTASQIIILAISLWVNARKNSSEARLENTQENLNWKKLYDESMNEVKRVLKENKEIKATNEQIKIENQNIKAMFKQSHIKVVLDIPIGGVPSVLEYEWKQLVENK